MEKNQIKIGDRIRIKENLMVELIRVGFNEDEFQDFVKQFSGKELPALDIWEDEFGEIFVTVDSCCEIPIEACEKLAH